MVYEIVKVTICDVKTSEECRSELVTNCNEFGAESSLSTACDELTAICDEFAASSRLATSGAFEIAGFDFQAGEFGGSNPFKATGLFLTF
jgi:hypothetical protein